MTIPFPIQPEDLTPDQLSIVPELPQERTATELMQMMAMLAAELGIDPNMLNQVRGQVCKSGEIGIYAVLEHPGSRTVTDWVAAFREYGNSELRTVRGLSPTEARKLYDEFERRLDA